jgi:hypothetical protein
MINYYNNAKYLLAIVVIIIATNTTAEQLIETDGHVVTKEDYEEVVVERTENKHSIDQSNLFEENLYKLIQINHGKVLFMCNEQQYGYPKRFGINTDNGWTCDFIISKHDRFRGPLDDHGSIEYQLMNIGDESIILRYKSEFNHNSFGNNKLTIDEGTVEVKYRQ